MLYTLTHKKGTATLDTETGNITGNTYPIKDDIKDTFKAKWNPSTKSWHSDNLEEKIEEYRNWLVRVYKLEEVKEEAKAARKDVYVAGKPCPKCGTYCYGECGL